MGQPPSSLACERRTLLAIALAGAFCFTGLFNHPLRAADETRVAGIGWEMWHGHTAPVPYLGGDPFLEHPPLYYSILGGAFGLLGAHEGVARLPGALASFLVLLLVFDLGRRVASPTAGVAGILMLVSMRGFFRYSHKVLVDPLLTLFVLAGFHAYVRAMSAAAGEGAGARESRGAPAGAIFAVYLAASLAFYTKGLIGVVAIAGPIALDVLFFRRFRALRSLGHLAGLPFLLAVCASWPVLLYELHGAAAVREFLVQNGIDRIFPGSAAHYVGGHQEPFWYYAETIPQVISLALLFVPGVAAWLRRASLPSSWDAGAIRFLSLVLPFGVLLLSFPGTKRSLYLLPFVPPLAVAVGAWMAALCLPDPSRSRAERAVAALSARLVRGLSRPATALSLALSPERSRIGREAAARDEHLAADVAAAAGGSCRGPLRLAGIGFGLSLAWNLLGYPLFVDHGRDLGPVSRGIAAAATAGLAGYELPEEIRGALPFYTGRIARNLHGEEDLARYLREHPGDALLHATPSPRPLPERSLRKLAPIHRWEKTELDYTLYEILPEPVTRADPRRSPPAP